MQTISRTLSSILNLSMQESQQLNKKKYKKKNLFDNRTSSIHSAQHIRGNDSNELVDIFLNHNQNNDAAMRRCEDAKMREKCC